MGIVTPKTLRQKLMQSAVLNKIQGKGLSIDTESVRRSRAAIRRQVGNSPLMDRYLDRWDEIIRTYGLDNLRRIVEAADDTRREMRNLSPLSVLLSTDDCSRVLGEFGTQFKATLRE
ncbi:hypothetical protein NQ854_25355 [Rhodococcus ruber]|uniref:hypothetical protein n=1 Tax=Rhodococcus ruber TaxID=1830 RepID=UPI00387DCFF2